MKKAIIGYIIVHIISLTVITIVAACSTSLFEEESLPSEIINDVKKMEIISSAHATLPDGYCWFVLARKEGGINTLRYYVLSDNRFCLRFESEQCIPQDLNNLLIGIDFGFEDFTTHDQYKLPILTISKMNESEGYLEWFIGYEYENIDTWRLMRIWNYSEFGNVLIKDNCIQIYEDIETDQPFLSQEFEYDLNLSNINYSSLISYINKIVESFLESVENPEGIHG